MQNCRLCCHGWLQSKIERKWKGGYVPRSCLEIKKKTVEHESDNLIVIGAFGTGTEG